MSENGSIEIRDKSMLLKSDRFAIAYNSDEDSISGLFMDEDYANKFIEKFKLLTKQPELEITREVFEEPIHHVKLSFKIEAREEVCINRIDETSESKTFKVFKVSVADRQAALCSLFYLTGIKPEDLTEDMRWPFLHLLHKGVFSFEK